MEKWLGKRAPAGRCLVAHALTIPVRTGTPVLRFFVSVPSENHEFGRIAHRQPAQQRRIDQAENRSVSPNSQCQC